MKKNNTFWWLVVIAVVILGIWYFRSRPAEEAGETGGAAEQPAAGEEAPSEEPAAEEEAVAGAPTGAITLKAEAQGNGQVQLTWETTAEPSDEDKFMLVRGTEENPVHDGSHYWFRQHGTRRSAVWGSQPAGTFHYRMCILTDEAGETCGAYSNDVTVEGQ